MKNTVLALVIMLAGASWSHAQFVPYTPTPLQRNTSPRQENNEDLDSGQKGFNKERLVFGGNLGASFGNYTFVNLSPQVGYMFNRYITAGVGVNYLYNRFKYANGDKESYSFAGTNLFARVYPFRFMYLMVQPEMDYSWGKYKYGNYTDQPAYKIPGQWIPVTLVGAGAVLSPNGKGGMLVGVQYDVIQNSRSPYGSKPYLNISFAF